MEEVPGDGIMSRRGAVRRKSSNVNTFQESCHTVQEEALDERVEGHVEEDLIVPITVDVEHIRKERMKSVKKPCILVDMTDDFVVTNPVDRRTTSIRRAQVGMRDDERKALIKDDFAYIFFKMAGDDELLDAFELQHFMHLIYKQKYPKASDFNLETCRAMIASLDVNMRGKVSFEQFKKLWMRLMRWAHTYNTSDIDQNGNMDRSEFGVAMHKLGFRLCEKHMSMLMNKFQTREKMIQLDDFIQICCKARSAKCAFQKACDGRIQIGTATLGDFMNEILKT